MSTSSCVFCGENHMFKTMNVKIANGVIERCRNCGGYRLNPPHIVDYDDSGWSSMRKTDWQKDVERGRAYARKITKWYYSKTKKSLSSILEVGCGSAYMAPGFTENGVSYTGIDVDSASVEFAKSNAIDVHRVSAEELNKSPLAGKKYDLVLSSNALEHVNCPMKSFESIKECIVREENSNHKIWLLC